MDKQVITYEKATEEITEWLDYKKIGSKKREATQEMVETLVSAMCEGYLYKKEDESFVQKLKFPLQNEMTVDTLEYKPRLAVKDVQPHLRGVKGDDGDGRLLAHVAALTNKPKELLRALDTEDNNIAQAIAIFFV